MLCGFVFPSAFFNNVIDVPSDKLATSSRFACSPAAEDDQPDVSSTPLPALPILPVIKESIQCIAHS